MTELVATDQLSVEVAEVVALTRNWKDGCFEK